MKKINLRELYPDAYTTDFFVNVTEDVLETIRASERAEAAYERKMYRYKAQYSLDCENGIENTVLTKPQTPEMVLEEKQLQKQVYSQEAKEGGLSGSLAAYQTEQFLILGAWMEYPADSSQQEVLEHFFHIVALVCP